MDKCTARGLTNIADFDAVLHDDEFRPPEKTSPCPENDYGQR